MIKINLRNQNRIILLEAVGKTPIRGRASASPYFYSPLELLLSALGLCVGGTIIEYCRLNDINVNIFEEVMVLLDPLNFIINIKRPKDFDKETQERLQRTIEACQIAKELSRKIKIVWGENSIPTEELLKELPKTCCGG